MFPCLETATLYEVNNGYSIFIISISDHEWQLICFDAFFYSLQRTIKNEHFNNANRFSLQAFSRVSKKICCTKSELYNKYLICYTNKSPQGANNKISQSICFITGLIFLSIRPAGERLQLLLSSHLYEKRMLRYLLFSVLSCASIFPVRASRLVNKLHIYSAFEP